MIERGQGATLWDTDGNAYLDATSALWCTVHGHRHPTIDAAVREQLDKVAHSTFLGLSHPPGVELAAKLVELSPPGLERVFFSDNGSTACEIALKMAFQWWAQRGETRRTRFVCHEMSYHGDTLGAVSVGAIPLFHELYEPLLFSSRAVPAGDAAALDAAIDDTVAAVIVEPLVQGAAGMLVHPEGWLREVRRICDRHGVLMIVLPAAGIGAVLHGFIKGVLFNPMIVCVSLIVGGFVLMIVDEVATGFGRTGRMFACEHESVVPDLMCLAKGLTGGYLPLAATLTTERVYRGFLGAHSEFRTFFHGHTYTANPLACAAALATIEVFEQENTIGALQDKIALLGRLLADDVAPLPTVREVRRCGFMVGVELVTFPLEARIGHQVTLAARERGVIVRPLGDVVVIMAPLCVTDDELRTIVGTVAESISAVTGGALRAAA